MHCVSLLYIYPSRSLPLLLIKFQCLLKTTETITSAPPSNSANVCPSNTACDRYWELMLWDESSAGTMVILTLRESVDGILSRGSNFSIGCVHREEQEPVLIAALQNQRLTAQDGDAVPLWSVQIGSKTALIIHPHRHLHRQKVIHLSLRTVTL